MVAAMSLDATTGVLTYDDGARIDPAAPLSAFRASPLGAEASSRERDAWTWLELPSRLTGGVAFSATLTFEGERLFSISLHLPRAGTAGYASWSFDEEQAIVAEGARWLAAAVGDGRHDFPWGSAGSGFDERSASAYLVIRYRPASTT
jgi:hypothetical protein